MKKMMSLFLGVVVLGTATAVYAGKAAPCICNLPKTGDKSAAAEPSLSVASASASASTSTSVGVASAASVAVAVVDAGNKLCPVSGGPVSDDPALTAEYKGKLYHFCCPGCKPVFLKDPEIYIKKMNSAAPTA